MRKYKTRCLVAVAVMAVAGPLALYLQFDVPAPSTADVLKDIPTEFAPWRMVDERGPSEDEKRILETDAILTRTYARGEPPQCDLSVVFARDNRRVAHPPEICYKGSGWLVEKRDVVQFPVADKPFRANRLLLLRGEARLIVLYWYKAGDECMANYLSMQLNIIKTHIARRGSSSALCRVSAMSPEAGKDDEIESTLRAFAGLAIPEVNKVVH